MSGFVHTLQVRYHECDPSGIVFNANYAMYVDVAMGALWTHLFGSYEAAVEEYGTDLVVGSLMIDFRSPARPEDVLDVELTLEGIGTSSITFAFHLGRDSTTVARGTIRYVCVDPATVAKTPVPERLREALGSVGPAATGRGPV